MIKQHFYFKIFVSVIIMVEYKRVHKINKIKIHLFCITVMFWSPIIM